GRRPADTRPGPIVTSPMDRRPTCCRDWKIKSSASPQDFGTVFWRDPCYTRALLRPWTAIWWVETFRGGRSTFAISCFGRPGGTMPLRHGTFTSARHRLRPGAEYTACAAIMQPKRHWPAGNKKLEHPSNLRFASPASIQSVGEAVWYVIFLRQQDDSG